MDKAATAHRLEATRAVATNKLNNTTVVDMIITVALMPKAMAATTMTLRPTIISQLKTELEILPRII
jgi:hypothetical protein